MERVLLWWLVCRLVVFAAAQDATHNTTDSQPPAPSYFLLVPGALRPGVPTSVSVTIFGKAAVSVTARVVHGKQQVVTRTATVAAGSTEEITLPAVDNNDNSDPFSLEVSGHVDGREVFFNSTQLILDPEGAMTFIQTDRGAYRPQQTVKIRVVSVRADRRPGGRVTELLVMDPKGNLLRQWSSLPSILGVASKEFRLSENPPLGLWSVMATADGVSTKKHFTVERYVLPKFEVVIEAPPIIFHEEPLNGRISATYVFGKPVKGDVSISFVHHYHGVQEEHHQDKKIDGVVDFQFEVPDFHPMRRRPLDAVFYEGMAGQEFVTIEAHVTEQLTGATWGGHTHVSLAKHKYKLSFSSYPEILKPSMNVSAVLQISTYNAAPLSEEDRGKMVQVSVIQRRQSPWSWRTDEDDAPRWAEGLPSRPEELPPLDLELPVPADGELRLLVPVQSDTHTLTIDASFEDAHSSLQLYRRYTSPSGSYMQIQRPAALPQVGTPLQLHVQASFPLTQLHYVVTSRGGVVSAGSGSADLTLVPEASWAPFAHVLVFCVHPSGEVINAALRLPLRPPLQNSVSLSWSVDTARPGDAVTLQVKVAEPGSLVGILVLDKATQGLGPANNLTEKMVLEQMEASVYHVQTMTIGDPYSVFKTCDLVALTDASLHATNNLLNPEFPGEGIFFLADTDTPQPEQSIEEPRVRQNFPETWIWMDILTGNSDMAELQLTVPDSITTWTATAFVMSENLGLGSIQEPAQLTVFQDFFLSLNLPAYIIRGEELLLEVLLFNYHPQDLEVMVIVAQSDTFQFVFPDNEEIPTPAVRRLRVASQSEALVLVPIRPLVLGQIPISVKAVSSVASDLVQRFVLVKAEGIQQSFFTSLLFEGLAILSENVTFSFPADVVEGSARAAVTVVGDILGPSISGLNSLIQMPHGCGEQNMINFAPNIYILQYLGASRQSDPDITHTATEYMTAGYEQELTYQRSDGSFSAFGDQDQSGSTWLSAFVLRCFLQAQSFISIERRVLDGVAAWLAAQQGPDGRFEEPGRVIHSELQGGQDDATSLTAYVLIAMLGDEGIRAQYNSQVSAALVFLETRLALGVSSNYSLSLLAYALALDGSSTAGMALNQLLDRADEKDGVLTWAPPWDGLPTSWQPRSADIEMVSYVLLCQHELGLWAEGVTLMKWLGKQRNPSGGFGSTQDTVVALQALATWAALQKSLNFDLIITVDTATTRTSFHIHNDNRLVHQSQQIETEKTMNLRVTAKGSGLALFQFNVFYNVRKEAMARGKLNTDEGEAFHLEVELFEEDPDSAHLYICCSLTDRLRLNATGMAILEVGLLSGFVLAPNELLQVDVVRKVEMPAGKVVLYLDSVSREELCVLLPLDVEHRVARVREAAIVVYDYYEPGRRTLRTYRSEWRSHMSTCSLCGEDCSRCRAPQYDGGLMVSHGGSHFPLGGVKTHLLLLFLLFLLL